MTEDTDEARSAAMANMTREGTPDMTPARTAAAPEAAVRPVQLPSLANKPQPMAHSAIMAITPRNMDEAWRMAEAFSHAGMVPKSLEGNNAKETTAKVMLVICKGMEVGLGPVSAVQTIMVINNKPCIYGDGATALLQNSGVVEFIKTEQSGDPAVITADKADYKVTVTIKRKDQSEPYVRTFSYQDAIKARLITKPGPWTDYRARQCYWRAFSWAARDAASDALHGLAIAEEVNDYAIEARRNKTTDVSSLDDAPATEGTSHVA